MAERGTLAVVPARRLAQLLGDARRANDERLATVAARSGGRFSPGDLLALEAGTHDLDDDVVRDALVAYGVDPGVLSAERSRLVVDLDEGRLRAGEHETPLPAPTADEVLATYLSLVYTMRHAEPGTPVSLRDADIAVLSRVLQLASTDVETRLVDLMADPDQHVRRRHRWLRAKVLVPAAGVLVAATALGSLVLVNASPEPATVPATTTAPTTAELPPVSLIPPISIERDPGTGVTTPAAAEPTTTPDVSLIPPVVVERLPGGEPGPQVTLGP